MASRLRARAQLTRPRASVFPVVLLLCGAAAYALCVILAGMGIFVKDIRNYLIFNPFRVVELKRGHPG
jgi:hypothetical protein